MNLRDYQQHDMTKLKAAFKSFKSVLYQLSTGGGKTVVALHIIQGALGKGNITWFVVNRRRLVKQTSKAMTDAGIPHGIIASGFPETEATVQVVMIQSVVNRLDRLPLPRFLILDEFHNAKAATYEKVIQQIPDARILGLTATPCRLDGKPLNSIVQTMVTGKPLSWLIAEGYLCDVKIYAPPVGVEDVELKAQADGDYAIADIVDLMDKPTITGCAIQHYKNISPGKPALVFCASIKHAEHTAEAFRAAGINSESIDSTMATEKLDGIIGYFDDRQIDVVVSVDLVSEGFDLPCINTAIFLRHSASLRLVVQMIGRTLRPVYALGYDLATREGRLQAIAASDKPYAILLDHVGNIRRHDLLGLGLPEWDIEWSLDGEVKRKKPEESVVQVTQCDRCYYMHPPAKVCPNCGHCYEAKIRKMQAVIDEQLEEVRREELERIEKAEAQAAARAAKIAELAKQQKERSRMKREEWLCETLDDWQALAAQRGYKKGWAYMRYSLRGNQQ